MKQTYLIIFIVIIFAGLSAADWVIEPGSENSLQVISSDAQKTVLIYQLQKLQKEDIEIEEEHYSRLHLPGESRIITKGVPALPRVNRALLTGLDRQMQAKISYSEYQEFELQIAPAKGKISYSENYEDIPYTFGDIYGQDSFYPQAQVKLSEPYILRDYRGIDLEVYPVQYNPVDGKVRIYTFMRIEVYASGESSENTLSELPTQLVGAFQSVYKRHFVNYDEFREEERYPEVEEIPGRILIVCYDGFMDAMQPYVNWKRQKGIQTDIVAVSEAGTTSLVLHDYLENQYTETGHLAWVLFVGDAQQVPVIYSYSSYAGDPYYALVSGTDMYPDIMVGRFSAESVEDVETQVERSVYYERDISEGDWIQRAAGVAYNGTGGGQHNEGGPEHMNYIRDDLLNYGYFQVDQIYEGQGASTEVLANAINEGRGLINYLGHGEDQNYYSVPFYMNDVYNLQNQGMLPFVCNCACLIGNFAPQTCFAEYWLRATDNEGEAIGAIAFLASSISQWIGDPEYGQDEFVDILCAEEKQTIGGLWYNCINYAMEVTTEWDEFCCWNVFGDPNLVVRTKVPEPVEVSHMPAMLMGLPFFTVEAEEEGLLVCLSRFDEIIASGFTDESGVCELDVSEAQQVPGEITLTVSGLNKITLIETIQMIPPEGAYLYMEDYIVQSGEDNIIHAGETAFLNLDITNYGNEPATGINLEMRLADDYITVIDSIESIGNLESMENLFLENILCFEVSEDIEFAHPFFAELVFTSAEDSWSFDIWFSSYAPDGLWMSPGEIHYELVQGESAGINLVISNYLEEAVEVNLHLEPEETRGIGGSFVECDATEFLPGNSVMWNFTAYNHSTDGEWIAEIELEFPEAVEITEVSPFIGASGGNFETESELGAGAAILWLGYSANSWGFMHDGESASGAIEAEIDYADLDSVTVNWRLGGDGYGVEPHETTGTINIYNPLSWIYLHDIHETIQPADFSLIEIDLSAVRLTPGEYHCEIVVNDDRLESRLPVTLSVIPQTAENQDMIVETDQLQVYPNPFNPCLSISYSLAESGDIELAAYNIKGQKMAVLAQEYQNSGEYKYNWQADTLPSGVYFIRLKSNSITCVQKAILLK